MEPPTILCPLLFLSCFSLLTAIIRSYSCVTRRSSLTQALPAQRNSVAEPAGRVKPEPLPEPLRLEAGFAAALGRAAAVAPRVRILTLRT